MNKYEVLEVIDEGAYGVVLKALNKQSNKYVAIKKFKEGDEDEQVRRSIQRQIKMLKMLRSEYVIDLKEAFKRKGKVYLIFEFMDKNVLNLIEEYETGIPADIICSIMYQLFKGMYMLHEREIIHRDIKPQNLLLDSETKLKICDFGFTRFLPTNDEAMTDYVATRWYRSPQLLIGDEYGKPMDIWAAGCIMGQMIGGQPIFPGENEMDQLYLIRKMIGEFTASQNEIFHKNPRFIGLKFPELRNKTSIEERYIGKISKNAMSFLKSCLKMDPIVRMTAGQALKHAYFAHLVAKDPFPVEQLSNRLQQNDMEVAPTLPVRESIGMKTIYGAQLKDGTREQVLKNIDRYIDKSKQRKILQKKSERYNQNAQKQQDPKMVDFVSRRVPELNKQKKIPDNLPKIEQQKLLHSKVASHPLMPQFNMLRVADNNALMNLSVMGKAKSISKMKKI